MLKKRELSTREVTVDEQTFTVSEMTVRSRTRFEQVLARCGNSAMREALLLFCVSIDGRAAFPVTDYLDRVGNPPKEAIGENAENWRETEAAALLVENLAEYPASQIEPLTTAALEVNGLLGNDSAPTKSTDSALDSPKSSG